MHIQEKLFRRQDLYTAPRELRSYWRVATTSLFKMWLEKPPVTTTVEKTTSQTKSAFYASPFKRPSKEEQDQLDLQEEFLRSDDVLTSFHEDRPEEWYCKSKGVKLSVETIDNASLYESNRATTPFFY